MEQIRNVISDIEVPMNRQAYTNIGSLFAAMRDANYDIEIAIDVGLQHRTRDVNEYRLQLDNILRQYCFLPVFPYCFQSGSKVSPVNSTSNASIAIFFQDHEGLT